ncbi:MAG: CHAT domain-containing protein [Cyanobacteria bacterium J06639_1]
MMNGRRVLCLGLAALIACAPRAALGQAHHRDRPAIFARTRSPLEEARELVEAERYAEAERLLLDELARQPDLASKRQTDIELLLGAIAWYQRDFATARSRYREGLRRVPTSVPALVRLGLLDYEDGQRDRALDRWQAALDIDDSAADAQLAVAIALDDLGDREAALELGESAIRQEVRYVDPEFLRQNLWGERAIASVEVLAAAVYEYVQAKNAEAERTIAAMTEIQSLNEQVQQLHEDGRTSDAIPLAERMLALTRQAFAGEPTVIVNSANNLAFLYDTKGRYPEAERLYREASEILEGVFEGDRPEIATNLNNLAALYDNQGRYDEAEQLYIRALDMRRRLFDSDHPDIAISLNNLAFLYDNLERYDEAQPLHREALAMLQRLFEGDRPEVATSLNNLAASYSNAGRFDEAEPLYLQALEMRQRLFEDGHPDIALSYNNLASLNVNLGRYDESARLFERSLEMMQARFPDAHPWVAFNLSNLAAVYEATGEYARSLDLSLRAADVEEQMLAANLVTGSERQKRQFLNLFRRRTHSAISFHLQSVPSDRAAAELAFTTLLRRKGRVLDVMSASLTRVRQTLNPDDRERFDRLSQLYERISSLKAGAEGERDRLEDLEAEAEALQKDLFDRSAALRRELTPVNIDDVREALPEDAALIEFVEYAPFNARARLRSKRYGAPRYAAYILLPDGTLHWQELGDAAVIDEAIRNFHLNLRRSWEASGRDLYDRLFAPLESKLGDATHLLLAPDSALNLLPFAALIDPDNDYLIERYRLTYLTSGRDLLRLETAPDPLTPPLLLADPVFESTRPTMLAPNPERQQRSASLTDVSFGALTYAREEAEAIAPLFPGLRTLTGTAATENALKQARRPQFLHVATHGFFEGDRQAIEPQDSDLTPEPYRGENPLLLSGLALAGFNDRSSGSEDGVLTALEVSGLDLRGTELVVLSACDTGLGNIESGEGVYGLRRAFALAGAQSQVMSLWNVDDESTKDLMVKFYQHLQAGEGRSEALRQVQLDMLADPYWESPYFWAAFIPTGDWQPLDFGGDR